MLPVIVLVSSVARSDSNVAMPPNSRNRDAVQNDPASTLRPPASMEEFHILSQGARINGLMYLAAGSGPHPIVIFLHGYPGNERNLDLAQAVRRAGYNALFIDYRGNFGSGGTFSQAHSLEDIAALLAWVRAPETIAKYRVDPMRIALVGHSFGAWLALFSVENEPRGVCVAALAAWNAGWVGERFAGHPNERAEFLAYYRDTTDVAGGPIRANPDELIDEVTVQAPAWNYVSQASGLKNHALLLVAATRDSPDENPERHSELAAAIRKEGGKLVRVVTFEDDHPFSSHRIALAHLLTHWLRTDCARTQAASENPKMATRD
jgi:pimeloyl-ACP methyl ester carboxylesterase